MKKHIQNLFSIEEAAMLASLIEVEKESRKLFVWDEFGGDPYPQDIMDDPSYYINNKSLGKIMFNFTLPQILIDKLNSLMAELGLDAEYFCSTYTEYSAKYGSPVLQPHKDRMNFCLVDYQLEANTSWPLCIDDEEYDLSDNEAIAFLPAQLTHSRVDKVFAENDCVKMIFFDMKFRNE